MPRNVQSINEVTPGVWTEVATEDQITAQLARLSSDTQPFTVAVKANIGVADFTRSAGSKAFAHCNESTDSSVVAALRAAGAVVTGITNMHELAFGITSTNASYGPVPLPGHPGHSAGGSSGGSAAAVAEGSVDIALGTDTGGSVSLPASHCGVFGFRPTTGRWPSDGIVGLSWTRDTPGVFTRTLEQAVQVDTWITNETTTPRLDKLRLGLPCQFRTGLDPHTSAALEHAVEALGHHVEIIEVDYSAVLELTGPTEMPVVLWEARQLLSTVAAEVFQTSPAAGFERLSNEVTSPDVAALLQSQLARPVTQEAYGEAQQGVVRARSAYTEFLAEHDLDAIIFPAAPAPAPPLNTTDFVRHLGQDENTFLLHTRHTGQGTMLAAPMVTIPLPVAESELPVGLTVQGARFADRTLLSVAQQLNRSL